MTHPRIPRPVHWLGGRRIAPVPLALSINYVAAVMGFLPFLPTSIRHYSGIMPLIAGTASAVLVALLVVAWWMDSQRLLLIALKASTVVSMWCAMVVYHAGAWVTGTYWLGWAALSIGSLWLEERSGDSR